MILKRAITLICILLFAANLAYSQGFTPAPVLNQQIVQDDYTPQQDLRKYKKHTVKWYESIEDIATKYKVSVEAIMDLNRLESKKLTRRQVLYIPDVNYVITPKEIEAEIVGEDLTDGDDIEDDIYTYPQSFKDHIDISLIMPFNSRNVESKSDNNWLDFYSGALLALAEFKSEGHSVNLNVIDMGDYSNVYEMIHSGIWEESDIIIGPPALEELEVFLPQVNRKRIPLISLIDQRADRLLTDSPYFFQVPPSGESQYNNMIKKIARNQDINKIVIFETGYEATNRVVSTLQDLTRYDIPFKTFSFPLIESREIEIRMKESLIPGDNTIIICSENPAFISEALRNLYNIKISDNTLEINTYAPPMVMDTGNFNLEYLHNLNVHLSLLHYVDNTNPVTKDFNRKYIEYFRTSPTPYSYQGYDIFKFFGSMLIKYGSSFPLYIEGEELKLLQSTMRFIHVPEGGFKNGATRDIVYTKNWSIIVE